MFGWKIVRNQASYVDPTDDFNYRFERIDTHINEIHRLISSLYRELGYYTPDPYDGDLKLRKRLKEDS